MLFTQIEERPVVILGRTAAGAWSTLAINDDGSLPADSIASGVPTDGGGTITAGGTAQQVAAAKTGRKWFNFQNTSDTRMWLNMRGDTAVAASPSFIVEPGAGYESSAAFCTNTAISVICATTGKAFSYNEF